MSLVVTTKGLPIGVQLSNGKRHDQYACKQVLKEIPKGSQVTADRGYDARWFRDYLRKMGFSPNIAWRSLSRQGKGGKTKERDPFPAKPAPNPLTYRNRWVIERTFAWMEKFKRLILRRERLAYLYEAFWHLGCAHLLLDRFLR